MQLFRMDITTGRWTDTATGRCAPPGSQGGGGREVANDLARRNLEFVIEV